MDIMLCPRCNSSLTNPLTVDPDGVLVLRCGDCWLEFRADSIFLMPDHAVVRLARVKPRTALYNLLREVLHGRKEG